jgi:hypothetical protein
MKHAIVAIILGFFGAAYSAYAQTYRIEGWEVGRTNVAGMPSPFSASKSSVVWLEDYADESKRYLFPQLDLSCVTRQNPLTRRPFSQLELSIFWTSRRAVKEFESATRPGWHYFKSALLINGDSYGDAAMQVESMGTSMVLLSTRVTSQKAIEELFANLAERDRLNVALDFDVAGSKSIIELKGMRAAFTPVLRECGLSWWSAK